MVCLGVALEHEVDWAEKEAVGGEREDGCRDCFLLLLCRRD